MKSEKRNFILIVTITVIALAILTFKSLLVISNLSQLVTPKKERVFRYVQNHQKDLKKICDDDILFESNEKERWYLKTRLGLFTIVQGVWDYTHGKKEKVGFYCGGSGFVGGSTSVGFYYSADDEPYGLEFDYYGLSEIGDGIYEWHNEYNSHCITTERICENWFYYYMEWY